MTTLCFIKSNGDVILGCTTANDITSWSIGTQVSISVPTNTYVTDQFTFVGEIVHNNVTIVDDEIKDINVNIEVEPDCIQRYYNRDKEPSEHSIDYILNNLDK